MRNYKIIKETVNCDEEYYYQIIRKKIRQFRLAQNLTQQELADLTGLSREYICDIENLKKNKHFSISTLTKISVAPGKDLKDFL